MDSIFDTERLSFRLMGPEHEANLERLDGDPKVRKFFPPKRPSSKQRIENNRQSFRAHGFCDFALFEKDTGAFAGRAGFHLMDDGEVEVGYLFLPHLWGKGYATEALAGLLNWAKTLPVERFPRRRIIAFAGTDHLASLRVMAKAGMTKWKTESVDGMECAFYVAPL